MTKVGILIKKESETYARHPLPPVHINTNDPNTYDCINYEKILKSIQMYLL